MTAPEPPCFDHLLKALNNEPYEGRVPFFEIGVDQEIMKAVVGGFPQDQLTENRALDFYLGLGYDYVPVGVRCHQEGSGMASRNAEDTAILSRGTRGWAPMDGVVKTREEYENFGWADPEAPETEAIESMAKVLPEGMMIIASTVGLQEPLAERIMGVKALSRNLYRDPDLVRDVCRRLGEPKVAAAKAAAEIDEVGAVNCCDDFGYQSGTLLSPEHLKRYILKWHRRIVKAVHSCGKPAILHSCGNLHGVMDEIIDYCGYDAKHSFKDSHTPIAEAKRLWGDRIALLGGIDMDTLSRRTESYVRGYVRGVLEECAGRGFALGSGNSVANYVPVSNYLAMLDEGAKFVVR